MSNTTKHPYQIQAQNEIKKHQSIISSVAFSHLVIRTLKTQNVEQMDFHTLGVWNIKSALESAFVHGHVAGQKYRDKTIDAQLTEAYEAGRRKGFEDGKEYGFQVAHIPRPVDRIPK